MASGMYGYGLLYVDVPNLELWGIWNMCTDFE
jgi:hypothetical protein